MATNTNYVSSWKSKGLSDESVKPPAASDNSLTPFLIYCGTKARELFGGDCLKQNKVTFNNGKIVNIYIVHEIIRIANIDCDRNSNLTVKNASFGAVSLTKYGHLNNINIVDMEHDLIEHHIFPFLVVGMVKM